MGSVVTLAGSASEGADFGGIGCGAGRTGGFGFFGAGNVVIKVRGLFETMIRHNIYCASFTYGRPGLLQPSHMAEKNE